MAVLLKIGPYSRADAIKDAADRLKAACSKILTEPLLMEDRAVDGNGAIHLRLASHLAELNDALGGYVKELTPPQIETGD